MLRTNSPSYALKGVGVLYEGLVSGIEVEVVVWQTACQPLTVLREWTLGKVGGRLMGQITGVAELLRV